MAFVFSLRLLDHQKLEREARICRLLKHPNIGKHPCLGYFGVFCRRWKEQRSAAFEYGTTSVPGPSSGITVCPGGIAAMSCSEFWGILV